MRADREKADSAVEGIVYFGHLGAKATMVGRKDIDWSGPQHKHQEWPAQLNRFFQVPPLASAYKDTRQEKYAEAARDYIADWIRAHPPEEDWHMGGSYDNVLSLSVRVRVWLSTLPAFLDSAAFDDSFLEQVVESARVQLDYLAGHMAQVGNWRIANADALLSGGIRLAFLPQAERWRVVGVRSINDAFHRQIMPDGVHVEHNPGYHDWMTILFTKYWRLGNAIPELGLRIAPDVVARMYDYSLAAVRPSGQRCALHDCSGAITGRRNPDWCKERSEFRKEIGLPDELPTTSQFFPCAGQAFLRDSWDEDATYIVLDATVWGGGHCHLSRNSIQLHAFGRSLVVDPGSLTYEPTDPMMSHGKSTRAHNTVNLNGWNQSRANPETHFRSVEGYDVVDSLYTGGYWSGRYTWGFGEGLQEGLHAEHHRTLLWVRGGCVVVLDHIFSEDAPGRKPAVETNWQLCEGPAEIDADDWRAVTGHGDGNVLILFPLRPEGARLSIHEGELDPPRGWLPGKGAYTPAPQLCLSVHDYGQRVADFVTVLIPFKGCDVPVVRAQASGPGESGVGKLTLQWRDASVDEVYWKPCLDRAIEEQEGFHTDASLVHFHLGPEGRLVKGLVVDGTYIDPYSPDGLPNPQTFVIP